MDCFFVAVAVRGRPELKQLPVAVAHSGNAGSSEISSCNYLARAKGVGAGMFMQRAKKLCPELVVLPYQFDAIQRVSFQIYDIFFSHTPYVQAVSCDEAFLEFEQGTSGMEKAKTIRQEIFEQTCCPASVGVSYNLLLAKLSSRKAKPDGIYQINDPSQAESFMLSLKIGGLPGVGYKIRSKLEDSGVGNVQQLVSKSKDELVEILGQASGEKLFANARGRDVSPLSVESNMTRKSVSAVVNFGIRFQSWGDATVFLKALGEELSHRLRNLKARAKCLTLMIKKRAEGAPVEPSKFMGHGVCDNFSKIHVLSQATDDEVVISTVCIELLRRFNFPSKELRGVGVQASKLVLNAPNTSQRSGQLFEAWLNDPVQSTSILHTSREQSDPERVDGGAKKQESTDRNNYVSTTFSQINMEVLDELPDQLQREILASYSRGAPTSTVVQKSRQPPKRKTNGKAPLRPKNLARNMFDSKSNRRLAQTSIGGPKRGDALNDIRISQVDLEVYQSLPLPIRREVDRYAKKRKINPMTVPLARPKGQPDATSLDQVVKEKPQPVVLSSIEDLYANLAKSLQSAAVCDDESGDDGQQVANNKAQLAAFDAIYLRILVEVENRTLDQALRMLRFFRRKCSGATAPVKVTEFLKHGFNHVLDLVNQDVRRHFNGRLSSQLVASL
uniref:DNA repair protein REV1 n=1 Tax=Hyaloperonospora arabidopsidis (strain Emoy2) TaxID=559515 RepID=M4B624_HYAAE